MRKIYYQAALAAGFFTCLLSGILPLKNRAGSAFADSAAQADTRRPAAAPRQNRTACERMAFAGQSYIICRADPARDQIRLFLADSQGRPFNYFRAVRSFLAEHGEQALFLMNAGMYHQDYSPVGLYVSDGRQLSPAAAARGKGNFFMKPNGVFYLAGGKAGVMETAAFLKAGIKPQLATQSGPMLVLDNRLHPKFIRDSSFKEYRNGVGVTKAGEAVFAISEQKVNFDTFARLFRDGLRTPNALFLDGSISSLYAPSVHRADWFYPMGPIIGVVRKAD